MASDMSWLGLSRFKEANRPYKLIEHEQGSDAWKAWRLKGIGSTSAVVIAGNNPWKTPYQLWRELVTGEESFKGNAATRRGQDAEAGIRSAYSKLVGTEYDPECAEHAEIPHFRTSLDGVCHVTRSVIEVKSHNIKLMIKVRAEGIPKYYLDQCQWHLIVTGYDYCDYVAAPEGWGGNTSILYIQRVEKDLEWQKQLITKANEFWERVISKTPPETAEQQIDDLQLENKLIDRQVLLAKKTALEKEIEELTKDIKSQVRSDKAVCGKFKLQFVVSKGRVDYSAVPELEGVDLTKYRGEETISFRIKYGSDSND